MAGLFLVKQNIEFGEYGNPIVNVYGYRSNLTVINEINILLDAFHDQVLPAWADIVSDSAATISLEALELNGTGYAIHVLTPPVDGVAAGDQDPPFVAWSFILQRAASGERSGGKRIGPISAATHVDRIPTAGMLDALNVFAAAYAAPLTVGLIETWFPVILERPVEEGDPWADHASNGARFLAVSTQNTRKK